MVGVVRTVVDIIISIILLPITLLLILVSLLTRLVALAVGLGAIAAVAWIAYFIYDTGRLDFTLLFLASMAALIVTNSR